VNNKLPKRKNIRLPHYDYSEPGAYFITICTKNKEKLLWNGSLDLQKFDWELVGEHSVLPQGLPLSNMGVVVEENLIKWNETYENIYLSSYVIMPNHLHLLVVIQHGAGGCTECPPTISAMVKFFKSSVTKQLGENIWQLSFYDHIIRGKRDFEEISQYICENPLKWQFDELYYEDEPIYSISQEK
jgi:REP element-mobilizing transposase RayT